MRKLTIYTVAALLFLSCQNNVNQKKSDDNAIPNSSSNPDLVDSSAALKFINDYVAYLNHEKQSVDLVAWVENNSLVSESFKTELRRIVDEAIKDDPEMGLDFDPILDAQDYPSEGFAVEHIDEKAGYIIVAGKKWNDFKLRMKVVKVKEKWLVDGAGRINIKENEISKENKAADDEDANFIVSDKEEKIYDIQLYLEKKIASGEIGPNPILQVDFQPVHYNKNQLVEKLNTLKIKQIKIIPKGPSMAVFGKTGADGILQIQTE